MPDPRPKTVAQGGLCLEIVCLRLVAVASLPLFGSPR